MNGMDMGCPLYEAVSGDDPLRPGRDSSDDQFDEKGYEHCLVTLMTPGYSGEWNGDE